MPRSAACRSSRIQTAGTRSAVARERPDDVLPELKGVALVVLPVILRDVDTERAQARPHREVRRRVGELPGASSTDDGAARLCFTRDGRDDRALSDAGFTGNESELPVSTERALEPSAERAKRRFTAMQNGFGGRHRGREHTGSRGVAPRTENSIDDVTARG